MKKYPIWNRIIVLICALSLGQMVYGEEVSNAVEEDPSAAAMVADAVVVRPIMLGLTVLGTALWVVSLPFSAAGGNVRQAADVLVIEPVKTTFVRCLGCTKNGYNR